MLKKRFLLFAMIFSLAFGLINVSNSVSAASRLEAGLGFSFDLDNTNTKDISIFTGDSFNFRVRTSLYKNNSSIKDEDLKDYKVRDVTFNSQLQVNPGYNDIMNDIYIGNKNAKVTLYNKLNNNIIKTSTLQFDDDGNLNIGELKYNEVATIDFTATMSTNYRKPHDNVIIRGAGFSATKNNINDSLELMDTMPYFIKFFNKDATLNPIDLNVDIQKNKILYNPKDKIYYTVTFKAMNPDSELNSLNMEFYFGNKISNFDVDVSSIQHGDRLSGVLLDSSKGYLKYEVNTLKYGDTYVLKFNTDLNNTDSFTPKIILNYADIGLGKFVTKTMTDKINTKFVENNDNDKADNYKFKDNTIDSNKNKDKISKPLSKYKSYQKGYTKYHQILVGKKYYTYKTDYKKGSTTSTSYFKQIKGKTKLTKTVTITKYNNQNVTTYYNTISYHGNGRVKNNTKIYRNKINNKITKKHKDLYYSNGNKQRQITLKYRSGRIHSRVEYVFNKKGQKKSNKYGKAYYYKTKYNKKGKATKTERRQFNKSGKQLKAKKIAKRTFF